MLKYCSFVLIVSFFATSAHAETCDDNYTGACVPIASDPVASDVDCQGGKGNGPVYVAGPFSVAGTDIYGLDHDKDGLACEPPRLNS